jgi:hypothetical protein
MNRPMNHQSLASVLAVVAFAAACGGGQPPPVPPPAPSETAAVPAPSAAEAPSASTPAVPSAAPSATAETAPAPPAAPGPGDWDKWSKDQKMAYMKSAVMPKMGPAFHDFDAKAFAEPKCVLCHGSGAKDGSFKMPNPELPKLDVSPAGIKKMHEKKGPVVDFMAKTVVPQMAQLVGEQPFDPKTKTGFGCLQCHTKK